MVKTVLLTVALMSCLACSKMSTAPEAAAEVIAQINEAKFEQSWENVAPASKRAVAKQLERVRSTPAGRKMVMGWLGVSESKLLALSPKDYYVLIMSKGHDPKAPPTVITSVTEGDEQAVVHWKKGERVAESTLVKESGRWYFVLDKVDGE